MRSERFTLLAFIVLSAGCLFGAALFFWNQNTLPGVLFLVAGIILSALAFGSLARQE
ncbi:MAG: hypothetical protein HY683_08790 [Chloroflexi bacterium]|nr:hypothetical protein [Chloroflexota bacterium]